MGKAVGIDLGTTNSVAAFFRVEGADPEVVEAKDANMPPDYRLMPSAVGYRSDSNTFVVGREAYALLKANPRDVITSIKRLMGRGFQDKEVQEQIDRFNYTVARSSQGTENSLVVLFASLTEGKKEFEPEDISAKILQQVIQSAKRERGVEVNQAVITIPAYFDDKQKYATRVAALRAGLEPLELLSEPTAAAISYGYKPDSNEAEVILVYDFGGGTFDASLITTSGNLISEESVAGDLWLGGDDIDTLIIDFVKKTIEADEDIDDLDVLIKKMPGHQRAAFISDLKKAAENAKVDLSRNTKTVVEPVTRLVDEAGMVVPVEVTVTREQLNNLIKPMVERTIAICHQSMRSSGYTINDVDRILMVGGSSQIPYVQDCIKQEFGDKKVLIHPRPMTAVAEGAAIVAAGKVEKTATVNRDYVIKLVDGYDVVLAKGELDFTVTRIYKTVTDGQRLIKLAFYNSDDVQMSLDSQELTEDKGQIWLGLDKEYPSGTEIQVTLNYSDKGEDIRITAVLKNDPSVRVTSSLSRGKEDETIYKRLNTLIEDLNSKGSLTSVGVKNLNQDAVPIIQMANRIIDRENGDVIRQDMYERATEAVEKLEWNFSDELNKASSYIQDCELYLEYSKSQIPDAQIARIEALVKKLKLAQDRKAIGEIEKISEDIKHELETVPPSANIPVYSVYAVKRAYQEDPRKGREMEIKLNKLVDATNDGNYSEAERILDELRPDVIYWLGQDEKSATVQTGIRK